MQKEGKGLILDQFANPDNPLAHLKVPTGNLAGYREKSLILSAQWGRPERSWEFPLI
jgi:hypothetical protein